MQFDWDDANRAHIALHGLEPEEVEEAVLDENALDFPAHRSSTRGRRFGVLGKAFENFILVVILEERGDAVRVVTAREANSKERIHYEKTNR